MVNEVNTNGEGDPTGISSRDSVPPSLRDYRAALAGGKQQDLATQILKDQVARAFDERIALRRAHARGMRRHARPRRAKCVDRRSAEIM